MQLNAKSRGKTTERNYIFDLNNDFLKKKGCLLRIREHLPQLSETLTFKGPLEEPKFNGIKIREELEFSLPPGSNTNLFEVLHNLGFIIKQRYSKQRQTFELNETLVQIDELSELGYFLEIEGQDEDKIKETIKLCELGKSKKITESYSELIVSSPFRIVKSSTERLKPKN
jgi:predicted adenylyl cyclase CyaB